MIGSLFKRARKTHRLEPAIAVFYYAELFYHKQHAEIGGILQTLSGKFSGCYFLLTVFLPVMLGSDVLIAR